MFNPQITMSITMSRIACVALSLFLSVMLVAKAPAADPDLEAIAVGVLKAAYQVADYDTVETLFDKLSLENKKKFLQEATVLSKVDTGEMDNPPNTLVDARFAIEIEYAVAAQFVTDMATPAKVLEQWREAKTEQTQLLGRLTLSLFEQSAKINPAGIHAKDFNPVFLAPHLRGGDEKLENPYYQSVAIVPDVQKRAKGTIHLRLHYAGDILSDHNISILDMISMITSVVEPKSWNGGDTQIGVHDATQSLAIRQTAEIHAQIENLLNQLRQKSSEPRVAAKDENEAWMMPMPGPRHLHFHSPHTRMW